MSQAEVFANDMQKRNRATIEAPHKASGPKKRADQLPAVISDVTLSRTQNPVIDQADIRTTPAHTGHEPVKTPTDKTNQTQERKITTGVGMKPQAPPPEIL
jgi:hypothetical protein